MLVDVALAVALVDQQLLGERFVEFPQFLDGEEEEVLAREVHLAVFKLHVRSLSPLS